MQRKNKNKIKMSFPKLPVRRGLGNLHLIAVSESGIDPRTLRAARCTPPTSGMTSLFNNGNDEILKQVQDDGLNFMGFTLIELLVVVLIIGILAAVAVPQYQKAVWKARFTQAKTMTKSLAEAEEVYYLANGEYTLDPEALSIELPGATCAMDGNYMRCTTSWEHCEIATHLNVDCNVYKNGNKYIEFSWWLDHSANPKVRTCSAYNTNVSDISNQVCKSETGRSAPDNSNSVYLSWHYR